MAGPWEKYAAQDQSEESGPWQKYAAPPPSTPSGTPFERFTSSASDALMALPRLGGQVLSGEVGPSDIIKGVAKSQFIDPAKTAWEHGKKAISELSPREAAKAALYAGSTLIPGGPMAVDVGKRAAEGDVAGALGTAAGNAPYIYAGGKLGGKAVSKLTDPEWVVPPVPTRYAAGPLAEALPYVGKALKAKRAITGEPPGTPQSVAGGLVLKYPGKKGVAAAKTPREEPAWRKVPELPPARATEAAPLPPAKLPSGRMVPSAEARAFDQPSSTPSTQSTPTAPASQPGKLEGGTRVARPEAYWPRELEPEVLNNKTTLSRMAHGVAKDLKLNHETLSDITSQRYGVESMKSLSIEQYRDLYRHLLGKLENQTVAPVPK